jgi:hypothetical protein
MDYNSITDIGFDFQDGAENASGIQELAYLVRVSDIQTEGKPDPAGTTSASLATITVDHVLKAGKSAIQVQPFFGKSGNTFALEGEELSKIFGSNAELMIPQVSAKALGGAAAIKNTRFIVLVRRTGQNVGFWQIGSGAMPAKVQDAAGGFGVGPTAEVGIKITLKAYDIVPMYEYLGELPVPAP